MAAIAESQWGANQIRYIEIYNPGDETAVVNIGRLLNSPLRASPELIFKASSGELLNSKEAMGSAALTVRDTLLGLHEGLFANIALRWLYFFSGIVGSVMIATGLVLWTLKRRQQQLLKSQGPDTGYRLVESLNLGMIAGLPLAIASYFWANRLLPVSFAERNLWEMHILFLTLLAIFLYPLLRSLLIKSDFFKTIKSSWVEVIWITAAAYFLLPFINSLTTDRHLLNSYITNDWLFVSIDLVFLTTGIVFACVARVMQKKSSTTPVVNKSSTRFVDAELTQ